MNSKSFMKPVLLTGFRLPVFHGPVLSACVSLGAILHQPRYTVSPYVSDMIHCIENEFHEDQIWFDLKKGAKVKVAWSCLTLQPCGLYSPWDFQDQNTGVGRLSLLQRIFPIQGSNPGLPHSRWMLYQLSQQGSSRIVEWVPYPFSSKSSQPGNQPGVSCIAGRFFTN